MQICMTDAEFILALGINVFAGESASGVGRGLAMTLGFF